MIIKLTMFLLLILSGCTTNIESRCTSAGLHIQELSIEDTGLLTSHAKVKCKHS